MTILISIIVLSVLVMFHEFGHFIVAKLSGARVNEFSIGFGPRLFKKKYGETEYSFRALLFGGYVALEGEDEKSNDPRAIVNKPWPVRLAVFAAGPLMNILLAFLLLFIVFFNIGSPIPQVKSVMEGYPAEKAGILPGDKIVMVNNTKINTWEELEKAISSNGERVLTIEIQRGNQILQKQVKPIFDKNASKVMIGIVPDYERSISLAFKTAINQTIYFSKLIILSLVMLVTGKVSVNDIMGPVGIVQAVGTVAKTGVINLLAFSALISVNLGLFNLLPLPALDGGRILFVLAEAVRGKPLPPEKEGYIHYLGFLLLIALLIFATYRDILRIF
ncbi:regulator of sigma E protease [Thermoanaerobacter thermohydrosulfuricus]|uniref:Zinc metalloprotease n=6 Tax=Thermoanaerobacter TaxID=1754 RepID=B0K9Q8_THEP3|nr:MULTISPECIES: RIP metalloprotease RseP [Thermoanaerobacter]EGD52873.1 membrane-associated zinc metalloprotease [Thermoanaerobacter ethanolicus JW 200]ABY94871.1 putative membrane-associated zinc metalloprotease [Thermoanaerobacter pseudethanolicus ATCC 33223]ADV79820.1 membrane-associated zinc metalloprotease [Thermoanaerobacter brockii subsp. finnii Ako-1]AEM78779.1 membrane-associated zinc metalloprotease [Thermoanaerobacter wiegelii Rt8.B1]EIW01140.1 putative membrane-associated Zn-depen